MKVWLYDFGYDEGVQSNALDAFRRDLIEVCQKHGMCFDGEITHDGIEDLTLRAFYENFDWDWLFDGARLSGLSILRDDEEGARLRDIERRRREYENRPNIAALQKFIEEEKERAFGDDRSVWEKAVSRSDVGGQL